GFPVAYTDTVAQWAFFDQAVERIAALPGVQSAAIASGLPAARQGFNGNGFEIEGQRYLKPSDYPPTRIASVTPDFFTTLSIKTLRGRTIMPSDRANAPPIVVVNKAFVDKFFPTVDPIGRRIRIGGANTTAPWLTIVGIVGNVF